MKKCFKNQGENLTHSKKQCTMVGLINAIKDSFSNFCLNVPECRKLYENHIRFRVQNYVKMQKIIWQSYQVQGLEICQSIENHMKIIMRFRVQKYVRVQKIIWQSYQVQGLEICQSVANHMKIILGLGFRNMSGCRKSYENHQEFQMQMMLLPPLVSW